MAFVGWQETDVVCPSTLSIRTVGTHLGFVSRFGGQTSQCIGIRGNRDEIVFVIVQADLPGSGCAFLRPAQRGGSVSDFCAGQLCGHLVGVRGAIYGVGIEYVARCSVIGGAV